MLLDKVLSRVNDTGIQRIMVFAYHGALSEQVVSTVLLEAGSESEDRLARILGVASGYGLFALEGEVVWDGAAESAQGAGVLCFFEVEFTFELLVEGHVLVLFDKVYWLLLLTGFTIGQLNLFLENKLCGVLRQV